MGSAEPDPIGVPRKRMIAADVAQEMQREPASTETNTGLPRAERPPGSGVERALTGSLRLAIIPVALLVLGTIGAFAYAVALFIHSASEVISHPFPVGNKIGLFLLDIDLMLIGATLLISAVGFYELFIRDIPAGEATRMPAWLQMHDLNDLKGRVIAMIVMVLSVNFVEVAVDSTNGRLVLELGGGIALVIVALTAFLRFTGHANDNS
jgi:uncharacterized membrane protein YqhA